MKRRCISWIVSLAFCFAFALPAHAEWIPYDQTPAADAASTEKCDEQEKEEYFYQYLLNRARDQGANSLGSGKKNSAGEQLTGNSRAIYDYLVPLIEDVAAGRCGLTEFRIPFLEAGIHDWDDAETNLITDRVTWALRLDYPFEMFWSLPLTFSTVIHDGYAGSSLIMRIEVAKEYQGTARFTIDWSAINEQRIETVLSNANQIIAENAEKNDYDKLRSYMETICRLVKYNYSAAMSPQSSNDYNPWQILSVFDDDPDTNVVCEGYAKAFQFLCDLSTFSEDVQCYSVTGSLSNQSGSGDHMWNIVRMGEGKKYLVDVTNCDTTGLVDKLFLGRVRNCAFDENGYEIRSSSGGEPVWYGYRVNVGGQMTLYLYHDSSMYWLWEAWDVLRLSETAYPVPAQIVELSVGEDTVTAAVRGILDNNVVLIAASYDADGRFLAYGNCFAYLSSYSPRTYELTLDLSEADSVSVFVLDEDWYPLCGKREILVRPQM